MRFQVTEADLTDYFYIDNHDCPIARAIKRKLPDSNPGVGGMNVHVTYKGRRREYAFSPQLNAKQHALIHKEAKPFSFTLHLE